jgi:hypothetical protein
MGLTSATLSNSCTKIRKRTVSRLVGRVIQEWVGSSPLRSTTPISANAFSVTISLQ